MKEGETLGVAGKNGSGKTTLLRVISGILKPYRGDVLINGTSIFEIRNIERAKLISLLPQFYETDVPFTVKEMIELGSYPYGRYKKEEVINIIRDFSLLEYRNRPFKELSGGEKQKVLLARCIFQNPSVYLLDEPSLHLDFENIIFIFEKLKKEAKEKKKIVIFVVHDLNILFKYSDKILLFRKDGIPLFMAKEEILKNKDILKEIYNVHFETGEVKGNIVFTY